MSEEQLTGPHRARLRERAQAVAGSHRFQTDPNASDPIVLDKRSVAFAAAHVHAVASDPDMPPFTVSILKIVADSLSDLVERKDEHPLAHLGVEGLRDLAEAEKDARVELEANVAELNQDNEGLEADLHRAQSIAHALAIAPRDQSDFCTMAWREAFIQACNIERKNGVEAATVLSSATQLANDSVDAILRKANAPDGDDFAVVVNRGLG